MMFYEKLLYLTKEGVLYGKEYTIFQWKMRTNF